MEKQITHKHHIIPRHMGGSDHNENIIVLTIEEHAEAHRVLFEKYNNRKDYIAWKSLLKQMEEQERNALLASIGGKTSAPIRKQRRNEPHMVEARKRRSERMTGKGNTMSGSRRLGNSSPNLRHIFVTPTGEFYGMGEAERANPGVPIRDYCLDRTDVPFTIFSKAHANLGFTKEFILGKTPRDLGYYTYQYVNPQPSVE